MKSSPTIIYLLLVLVGFFWGGAFNAAKIALADLPPLTVAFFRFALTSAILLPVVFIRRDSTSPPVNSRDLLGFLLLGLTGVFGYNFFFLLGMQYTSAVNGSLIVAASPMATILLAVPLLKEKIGVRQLAGALISLPGVALVAAGGSPRELLAWRCNPGDLLMLAAMFSWSLYAIVGKKVMLRHSPLVSTTYGCAMGALLLLIPAIVLDPGFTSLAGVGWPSAAAVFYLAVFASVLGFLWWNHGVSVIGAGKASVFVNLIPVSTMLISLAFHEPVTMPQIMGCALIIGGVTLAGRQGKEDMPLENATAATKT